MKPCANCKGRRFDISGSTASVSTILLTEDDGEFEIQNTEYGDTEWTDATSAVKCLECGKETSYLEWSGRQQHKANVVPTPRTNRFIAEVALGTLMQCGMCESAYIGPNPSNCPVCKSHDTETYQVHQAHLARQKQ